jgi:hypothetical protein
MRGNPVLAAYLAGMTPAEVYAYVDAYLWSDFVDAVRAEVPRYMQPRPVMPKPPTHRLDRVAYLLGRSK